EFVVMPNHIHGILILNNPVETLHATSLTYTTPENNALHATPENDALPVVVEALRATPLQQQKKPSEKNEQMSKISPKPNSISTIIRSYKSAVTKHANRLGLDFGWQSRFYDHIIRDEKAFENISNYIINNPLNWKKDKFH
ncbi:MAG: transposase, partial [Raineya sp.]